MYSEWLSTMLWSLAIVLIVAWLLLNLRYHSTTTQEIDSLADVEAHIGKGRLPSCSFSLLCEWPVFQYRPSLMGFRQRAHSK